MKRYLIIFISKDQFCASEIKAKSINKALIKFEKSGMSYEEIYAINRIIS
ncbi:MAG TPA: hypothetical protein VF849_00110 [Blattabacteriaceae bacterium]